MKHKGLFGICLVIAGSMGAADLRESTLVQVVNEVKVAPPQAAEKDARANDVVRAPDRIRTGAKSRAELKAADNTLTRIGANTVFSFEQSGRVLNLEKGSVLFHSPAGRGGGTIKSAGASAAVLGTTLMVAATPDGGFKCILLEGKGIITLPNGKSLRLAAGDMVYVPAGAQDFGTVVKVDLGKLVGGSQLVNGFDSQLPTLGDIRNEIAKQNIAIISGNYEETGLMVGGIGTFKSDPKAIDPVLQQTATAPPLFVRGEKPPQDGNDGAVITVFTGVGSAATQSAVSSPAPPAQRLPLVEGGGIAREVPFGVTTVVTPEQRRISGKGPIGP
ncbi:MAG TPA: FecR domain-containing protein [Methylomirabilota bacterium]|nr:FecR domain-containing protein [Methylomirabilota bacterium]